MKKVLYRKTINDFENIFTNSWQAEQTRQYLIKLYQDGETFEQIAAASKVMSEHSLKLPIARELQNSLLDNCGTGGDRSDSFNISTTVSILLSACGCKVAKHGNKSITSQSGSANMLEALGVNLDLDISSQVDMLLHTNFVFMFAIYHHKAMKHIMPIRQSINHRTIFNILGPLTNPACVKKQLIGVFDKTFLSNITKALKLNQSTSAIVVSSKDGLDEVSISDITYACSLRNGDINSFVINPEKVGLKFWAKNDIKGGNPKENAKITKDILQGKTTGAKLDIVLLNCAVALVVDAKVDNINDGIELSKTSIYDGNASKKLEQIIDVSNSF